jgi:HSP20 family molecular chaperone IbpA
MSNISVEKVTSNEKAASPLFAAINDRFDEIRRRAHEVFQLRGGALGGDLDDWLQAEREVLGWAKAELVEQAGRYEIRVELPGFDAKNIHVTASDDEILVRAAREQKTEENAAKKEGEAHVVWSEFRSDELYRRFCLPKAIQIDNVTAKLEKGILHIAAPCAAQAKPAAAVKQIKVAVA